MPRATLSAYLTCLALGFAPGCFTDAYRDPVEPVMMAVTNQTDQVLYLDMTDSTTVIGDAVQIRTKKQGRLFRPVPTCALPLCTDGCVVNACVPAFAVRALMPGETYSFEWQSFEFEDGVQGCEAGERACLVSKPAGDGRYTMTVCYGLSVRPREGALEVRRRNDDHNIIEDAIADDVRCAPALDFGVPGYDVRYQVQLY